MKRLTEQDEQGNWCLKGVHWNELYAGNVITKNMREKLYMALCKLKDYEATGLLPDEIESLNDFEKSQIAHLLQELGKEQSKHKWIPCCEGLPEEKTNPITGDFCEYQTTMKVGDLYDVRSCKFGDGHWWKYGVCMDECVVAWKRRPEPYEED